MILTYYYNHKNQSNSRLCRNLTGTHTLKKGNTNLGLYFLNCGQYGANA